MINTIVQGGTAAARHRRTVAPLGPLTLPVCSGLDTGVRGRIR
ncbi:hypothetical protein [Corynebacterium antarcticum]|uniref:Uncharacterized protein n=1 Tax=Corynebacterium antarcticum TaxID=2800405 RepID=A0A9Q4CBW5_9CORY|nr:hypothetical protein [Corynebacterium antarcticum]MCX7492015.1 hypothetical protein [Corynebacterium antarcticum]MCX7537936.1 hypothetical protein [Corynebacterium antarcticum]MCX7540102.1 hypothetical protein [Corynebacterium antarcticum]